MSDAVTLPSPAVRVEIDGGVVTSSHRVNRRGRFPVPEELGTIRFFVTVVFADGSEMGMWSGPEYDDAIAEAEELKRDFGVDIDDHVGGRRI